MGLRAIPRLAAMLIRFCFRQRWWPSVPNRHGGVRRQRWRNPLWLWLNAKWISTRGVGKWMRTMPDISYLVDAHGNVCSLSGGR